MIVMIMWIWDQEDSGTMICSLHIHCYLSYTAIQAQRFVRTGT